MNIESDISSNDDPDWHSIEIIHKKHKLSGKEKKVAKHSEPKDDGKSGKKPKPGKKQKMSDGNTLIGTEPASIEGNLAYLSRFRLNHSAGHSIIVVFQEVPAAKHLFKVPSDTPENVLPEESARDIGFRDQVEVKNIDAAAIIKPITHSSGLAWNYLHGVPQISPRNNIGDDAEEQVLAWQLNQYRLYETSKPEEDGGYRFIFTGSNRLNGNLFQNYFMQLEDLKKRIEHGNNLVVGQDKEALLDKRLPYPLWDNNGKLVEKTPQLLDTFRWIGCGRTGDLDTFDETQWTRNSFIWYCRLARQAHANPGLSYSVLARFWDKKWEPAPTLFLVVDISPRELFTYDGSDVQNPNEVQKEATAKLEELIDGIKQKRLFQPNFKIVWSKSSVPSGYTLWVVHPGSLYFIYIEKAVLKSLRTNDSLGIWLADRHFPETEAEIEKVDEKIRQEIERSGKGEYVGGNTAMTTTTCVTRKSIEDVKSYTRIPDQVTAMGGQSPNVLVKKWWGLKDGEKAAEWLHRSAWSYGGLSSTTNTIRRPQSSQAMCNLVIGTCEANTMMLRVETFVKRLAHYATKESERTGKSVKVTTTIKNPSGKDWRGPKWMKTANSTYAWFVPQLVYTVNWIPASGVPIIYQVTFETFSRRIPTRLELQLDELFENIHYGWDTTDNS
ncbi:hypothetical protein FRC18_002166 [Serendipita sp. 400]|nr:hypothetical protein FRC18_002166 [Serendipita sp. 400]